MTFKKMLRLLALLHDQGYKNGFVECTGGGELRFCFQTQLEKTGHQFMLSKGFIYWDQCYIYRPRTRG